MPRTDPFARLRPIALAALLLVALAPSASAAQASVTIQNFAFSPNPVAVTAGDTVVWTNADSSTHTATADDGSWSTGNIANGATSAPIAFPTAGTFSYHCAIHPTMTGTVTVASVAPVNQPPVAAFTFVAEGLNVSVAAANSTDADGSIAGYVWAWGDATAGSGVVANHTYATSGTFNITLTVTDDDGAVDSLTRTVNVTAPRQNAPPVASFTVAVDGLNVTVSANASSDPDGDSLTYAWEWDDGSPNGSGVVAAHAYATFGDYSIMLRVTDPAGLSSTTTRVANVSAPPPPPTLDPLAAFNVTTQDLNVTVDASASRDPDGNITKYSWDWGDGSQGSGRAATHAYARPGAFVITLVVTDDANATATTSRDVTVRGANRAPNATFTVETRGLNVTVDATASRDPDGTVVAYAWSWGDGAASRGATATHAFPFTGTFNITLDVTDDRGGVARATKAVTLEPIAAPAEPGETNATTTTTPAATTPSDETLVETPSPSLLSVILLVALAALAARRARRSER